MKALNLVWRFASWVLCALCTIQFIHYLFTDSQHFGMLFLAASIVFQQEARKAGAELAPKATIEN